MISEDFQKVVNQIGTDQIEIVHQNRSRSKKEREQYFTSKAKKLIWQRYEKDFLYFNYPAEE